MLKNLKKLFIIQEEVPDSPKVESVKKSPAASKRTPAGPPPSNKNRSVPSSPSIPTKGKVSNKFTDVLLKAMDRANLDGFDYLEYKRSLGNLTKMNMDEATRFQSAYAMAQTMGATPANLIETAKHYVDALKQEESKFAQALAGQEQKQIGDKKTKLEDLTKSIANKQNQIKKLQTDIEQAKAQKDKLQAQMEQANRKVANTKADFVASYDNLVHQINSDIDKMKTYLK